MWNHSLVKCNDINHSTAIPLSFAGCNLCFHLACIVVVGCLVFALHAISHRHRHSLTHSVTSNFFISFSFFLFFLFNVHVVVVEKRSTKCAFVLISYCECNRKCHTLTERHVAMVNSEPVQQFTCEWMRCGIVKTEIVYYDCVTCTGRSWVSQ